MQAAEPERDRDARRGRRIQAYPDQLQELDIVAVRYPVEAVEDLVGHPGERLDQGDSRSRDVGVGRLRAELLDQAFGVVDPVLDTTVVEACDRQCHASLS